MRLSPTVPMLRYARYEMMITKEIKVNVTQNALCLQYGKSILFDKGMWQECGRNVARMWQKSPVEVAF